MTHSFEKLLEPGMIGPVKTRNRMVKTANGTSYGEPDQTCGPRLTDAVHKLGCPVSIQFQHAGPWNPTGLLPRDPKIRDIKCASAMSQDELPGAALGPRATSPGRRSGPAGRTTPSIRCST